MEFTSHLLELPFKVLLACFLCGSGVIVAKSDRYLYLDILQYDFRHNNDMYVVYWCLLECMFTSFILHVLDIMRIQVMTVKPLIVRPEDLIWFFSLVFSWSLDHSSVII